ncbi:MAG: hypothetical protein GXO89_06115 [Chlorobi bacterium]|nr:hypothetical protein [Chlorobiota bacterium]
MKKPIIPIILILSLNLQAQFTSNVNFKKNLKTITTTLIILLLFTTSIAQKWEQTIGISNFDEESRRVIEHYDKGYIITGSFTGGYNDHHGWIIKTDINGNVLWDKIIGVDPDQVIIEKAVYDEQGNLYIFGLLWGDLDIDYPVIIKLNSCGEQQWCRLLYFEDYEYGAFYDGILLENGDLLGLANMPDEDQYDMIFLFCISPEGEYKWKRSYASKENHPDFEMRLGSRIQFFDDIYIISGYVYSPSPAYPTVTSIRPMFIGIDSLFNEKWVLEFALMDNLKGKAYDCILLNDSLFMGVGTKRFVEGGEIINNSALMFFNKNGIEQGYNIIQNGDISPSINSNFIYDIERVDDSLFITTSAFGENYEGNPWGEFIIDTSGNIFQYESREGTAGSSHIYKTFDNKYVIASSYWYPDLSYDVYLYKVNDSLEQDTVYPGSYTYDSLCPGTIQSGVIDLTGCGIITHTDDIPWLEDYNGQKSKVKITPIPNPVEGGTIKFKIQNNGFHSNTELKCFDVHGELVLRQKLGPSQVESIVHVGSWSPGIYVAVLYIGGSESGFCKFIIK